MDKYKLTKFYRYWCPHCELVFDIEGNKEDAMQAVDDHWNYCEGNDDRIKSNCWRVYPDEHDPNLTYVKVTEI